MNKPKTTTLNDLSLLGEVLLPSMVKQSPDEPNTIYLDPMTEEQRELQYGARIEPLPTTKRVSLLAKQNNRRY